MTLTLSAFLLQRIEDDERQAGIADLGDEYFTPARVLAECEAKRRIVELHREVTFEEAVERAAGGCRCRGGWPCPTLRALAAVYADHREEWRP